MDLGAIVSLTRLVNIVNIQSYQRKRPVTVFPVQRDVISFHEPQVHFPRKPLYLPRGFIGMCAPALHVSRLNTKPVSSRSGIFCSQRAGRESLAGQAFEVGQMCLRITISDSALRYEIILEKQMEP